MSDPQVVVVTAEMMRTRRVKDGTHAWVLGLIFAVPDPAVPVDDLDCGPENLVGAIPIYCIWCKVRYGTEQYTTVGPVCQG